MNQRIPGDVLHALIRPPSRRGVLRALIGAGLGLQAAPRPGLAVAKKKRKKCKPCPRERPCPGGRLRLSNGACAAVCAANEECAATCLCGSVPSVEGNRHCAPALTACEDVPQGCNSTSDCAVGQFCTALNVCGKRCVPVCG